MCFKKKKKECDLDSFGEVFAIGESVVKGMWERNWITGGFFDATFWGRVSIDQVHV